MRSFNIGNIRKIITVSAFSIAAILVTSGAANAQGHRGYDQRNQQQVQNQQQDRRSQQQVQNQQQDRRNQQQVQRQQQDLRDQQDRARMDQARAASERAKADQQRQQWDRQHNGSWINSGNNNNSRYRVYRNGSYYNTDQRGAASLQQAVNEGYQQGFAAGQADRIGRRNSSWNNSSVYRDGTYGYQSFVDRGQYQYYFQQGFQRGYQDGYNSQNQYGSNGGSILGAILGSILNIQTY
jgi:hypothetical protein